MKKTTKPSAKTVAAAKNKLKEELAKMGLSVEQAQDWLKKGSRGICTRANCNTCVPIDEKFEETFDETDEVEDDYTEESKQMFPFAEFSVNTNVTIKAGNTAGETQVFVGNTLLHGVTKATLAYDAETDLPVLTLEIVGVSVK